MTSDQVEGKAGSTQDPLIGTVFAERYEILSRLGEGGMSIVYKAHHRLMKKAVAIKMLQAHQMSKIANIKRFQQESQAVSALDHPNIIHVSDFGVTETGQPYLIMDYLEGISLSDLIHKEGALPVGRALHIFLQATDALAHAHSKGIIHRDLKPSNIMLVQHGEDENFVKIVDFGIAKLLPQDGEEHHQLTQTGEVFGSPLYMSPEQCVAGKLDGRSDIYSFGCVMYETLSGKPPFKGPTPLATIHMQITQVAERLNIPGCDSRLLTNLDAVVFKAGEKEPDKRYQKMEDLHKDLLQISQDTTGALLGGVPRTGLARASHKFKNWIRTHPLMAASITVGVLLGLTGTIWAISPMFEKIEPPKKEIAWLQPESLIKKDVPLDSTRIFIELIRREYVNRRSGSDRHIQLLNQLINTYMYAGQWNKAAVRLNELRDIEMEQDGPDSFTTADTTRKLLRCYIIVGDYSRKNQLLKKCNQVVTVYEAIHGRDNAKLAIPDAYFADVLEGAGYNEQAKQRYEKAVQLFRNGEGEDKDSPEMPMAFCRLADIYRRERNYKNSAKLYKDAIPLWKEIPNGQTNVLLCQYHLAQDLAQLKDPQAEPYYKAAIAGMEELWGKDSPNLIGPMLGYEQLLEKQNRWLEAIPMKDKIRDLVLGSKENK